MGDAHARTHAGTHARAGARGGEVRICGGRENFLSFYNLLSYYVLICFCRTDISFCHANKALTIQIELGGRGGVSERERESRLLCYQSEIIDSGYIGRRRSRIEMQSDREVVHSERIQ